MFNNLSVLENCVIGQMKVLKKSRDEAEKTAREFLAKVGMERFCSCKAKSNFWWSEATGGNSKSIGDAARSFII